MGTEDRVLVEDVMSTPLETISSDATVREAAQRMREQNINGLFVPGAEAGIITTTDVVDAVADGKSPSETTVEEVMTAPVERVTSSLELEQAATMMTTYDIKHLPVVDDDGDYVGMISSTEMTDELG